MVFLRNVHSSLAVRARVLAQVLARVLAQVLSCESTLPDPAAECNILRRISQ